MTQARDLADLGATATVMATDAELSSALSTARIPSGDTAGRPASPVIGDTYYNGEAELLEIYNGTEWVASSAPPATPSIVSVTDTGTNMPYAGGGTFTVVVSPGTGGASPLQYGVVTTSGGFTASSSTTTLTITGLIPGTGYQVAPNASNNFGTTVNGLPSATVVASTVPQTPTVVATPGPTSISYAMTGSDGGKAITNYEISTDGTTYTALSPAQTTSPVVISGLNGGQTYTYYFKAINANGKSIATSSVTASTPVGIDYVVVGGGAGATGYYYTGGAGSGSMLTGTLSGAVNVAYPLKVGAGGAQQNGPGGDGNPGTSSIFASITAAGGKGAAASAPLTNQVGGTQANSLAGGGSGGHATYSGDTAAGGGGAGAAGGNGGNAPAGNGGTGVATSISGSSVTYAGGGGGSAYATYARGSGGAGGGGNGTKGTDGQALGSAGATNTGGGGGGASHPANGADYGYGWAGGSGRVMLKINSARTATFSGGVTSSLSTSVVGFKVYTITAAGTGDTVTIS